MWDKNEKLKQSPGKDPALLEQYISLCADGVNQSTYVKAYKSYHFRHPHLYMLHFSCQSSIK